MKEIVFSICFTDSQEAEVKQRDLFSAQIAQIEKTGCKVELFNLDDNPQFRTELPIVTPPYLVIDGLANGTFRVAKGSFDELFDTINQTMQEALNN